MNERIRELVEQAFIITTDGKIGHVNNYMVEKFAELSVKECANMAESFHHHQYDFTGNLELHEFIKTHFGVEE